MTGADLKDARRQLGLSQAQLVKALGVHLRIGRCAAIYFIDRPFFGRRSCSLQFINIDGGAMFKVFVGAR